MLQILHGLINEMMLILTKTSKLTKGQWQSHSAFGGHCVLHSYKTESLVRTGAVSELANCEVV